MGRGSVVAAVFPGRLKRAPKPEVLNPAEGWHVIEEGGAPLACPECKAGQVYYFQRKRASFCVGCGKKVEDA